MKVEAVREAFGRFNPGVQVTGEKTRSGVSVQPVSLGEVARAVFHECDDSAGIEAGSFRLAAQSPDSFQVTVACVRGPAGESLGGGPFFELPAGGGPGGGEGRPGDGGRGSGGWVARGDVTRDAALMALAKVASPER
jgi:non-canonical (house-cleaning) NTP pyrophosphatase